MAALPKASRSKENRRADNEPESEVGLTTLGQPRLSEGAQPYPKNFNTCSANNAIPSPEKPMRVSVIVHVRRV